MTERLGMTVSGTDGVLKRRGIRRSQNRGRRPGTTQQPRTHPERDVEIVRRYQAGETLEGLGLAFGISRERVRQILVREGCAERHRGRARREAQQVTLVCPTCSRSRRIQPPRTKRRKDALCSSKCRALANPNHAGRRAYLMRRDEHLIWAEIDLRIGLVNSRAKARK